MKKLIATAIAGTALSMSAHAGLMGVKSIEISNVNGLDLQVAEVIAQTTTLSDAALSAYASASSLGGDLKSSGYQPAHNTSADLAIDGNTAGSFVAGQLYHGPRSTDAVKTSDHLLTITFNDIQDLLSLTIHGRDGCCEGRDFYNVSFFDASGSELYMTQIDSRNGVAGTATVSEPGTLALLGLGIVGLGLARRRQA